MHSSAYLSGEALQAYANIHKCLFLLVEPTKARGVVEIKLILAADNYSSSDPMFVINFVGETWDYYVANGKKSEEKFESAFRRSAEVSSYAFCFN
jgi:hypothetical protein